MIFDRLILYENSRSISSYRNEKKVLEVNILKWVKLAVLADYQ